MPPDLHGRGFRQEQEYGLTELGIGVGQLTNAIAEWSVQHVEEILTARQAFDARATAAPEPVT
jgi:DNA-binding HxlR family transcriptional regulator